jgi:hypothetical protein
MGKTRAEIDALEKSAKRLGATTIFTARQVAELQTNLARKGFKENQILQMQKSILQLAQATDEDLGKSATAVGAALRIFGLDASETGRVVDVMTKSFSESDLNLSKWRNAMKTVGPVAAAAGFDIEKTATFMAQLANSEISGTRAGTGLRKSLINIGLAGTELDEVIKGLSDKNTSLATAEKLVGKTGIAALSVLMKQADGFKELENTIRNSEGTARKMSATMGDTLFGSVKALESALEGVKLAAGEFLSEFVRPIIDEVTKVVSAFNRLSKSSKKMIFTILASVGIFSTLLAAVGAAAAGIAAMIALFGVLTPAVWAVIAAIAVLTTWMVKVATVVKRDWVKFKPLVDDFKDSALELFSAIKRLWGAFTGGDSAESSIVTLSDAMQALLVITTKTVDLFTFLIDKAASLGEIVDNNPLLKAGLKAQGVVRNPLGAIGGVAQAAGSVLNFKSEVKVEVPPGTPDDQQNFLQEAADKIFNKKFDRILRGAAANSPTGG